MVKLPYAHQKNCVNMEAPVEIYETQIVESKGTPPHTTLQGRIRSYFSGVLAPTIIPTSGRRIENVPSDHLPFFFGQQSFSKKMSKLQNAGFWKNKLCSMAVITYICGVFKPIQELIKSKNGNLPYTSIYFRYQQGQLLENFSSHRPQTHPTNFQLVFRGSGPRGLKSLVARCPYKWPKING